jgi:RNA polymerase sigma-70 factor, ECF subfamily
VIRATAGSPDADDIVQEAFLTLLKAAKAYDGRATARPFLIGIAAQLVRRRKRTFTRWARTLGLLATSIVQTEHDDPEHVAGVTEDLEHLQRALSRLSEDKRLVLVMIDGEGLSGLEVAEALGIPAATVRTRLHYARAEVRQSLAKRRSR